MYRNRVIDEEEQVDLANRRIGDLLDEHVTRGGLLWVDLSLEAALSQNGTPEDNPGGHGGGATAT